MSTKSHVEQPNAKALKYVTFGSQRKSRKRSNHECEQMYERVEILIASIDRFRKRRTPNVFTGVSVWNQLE